MSFAPWWMQEASAQRVQQQRLCYTPTCLAKKVSSSDHHHPHQQQHQRQQHQQQQQEQLSKTHHEAMVCCYSATCRTRAQVLLSEREREILLQLPRKELLVDHTHMRALLMGLVDILYAYCYDARATGGETSVESGWTISTLSSTLSWLQV